MKRIVLALLVLFVAGACSRPTPVDTSSPSPLPSPSPSPTPTMPAILQGSVNTVDAVDLTSSGSTVSVDIGVEDLAFNPTYIKISPAANVTVKATGVEGTDHTFTIRSLGLDRQLSSGPVDTFSLAAASSASVTFQAPRSGVVEFVCTIHESQGMRGAFYFSENQSPLPQASPDGSISGNSSSGGSTGSSGGGTSRSTGTRSGGTRSTGGTSNTAGQQASSGGSEAIDPLDDLINKAVGSIDGSADGDGTQSNSNTKQDATAAGTTGPGEGDKSKGTSSASDKGSPGTPGGKGESGDSGDAGEQGEGGSDGADGERRESS